MSWQYTHRVVPLIATVVILVSLAAYAWRRRTIPGAVWLTLLMLATAEWSLASALRLLSVEQATKEIWVRIQAVGVAFTPVLWLFFVIRYLGLGRRSGRTWALLCIEPVAMVALAFTNDLHSLVWREARLIRVYDELLVWKANYGPAFWVHVAYSCAIVLFGVWGLARATLLSHGARRRQIGVLLVATLAPLVGGALALIDPGLFPMELTPMGLALTVIAIVIGILSFRLLDMVPVAYNAVIESMVDGVIVVDKKGRVLDLNPAASKIVGLEMAQAVGKPIVKVLPGCAALSECNDKVMAQVEVSLPPPTDATEEERCYDLRISPLQDWHGRPLGRLIVLRDITERRRAEDALRDQRRLFQQLVAVARATAEQPALEDTLRNALTVVVELTAAEYGSLFLLDEQGKVTRSLSVCGDALLASRREAVARVMDGGLAGWVVHHRRAATIKDTLQDERWLELPGHVVIVRSALAVPIATGDALVGVLTLTHTSPGHFDDSHLRLMQAAADQISLALRNAQIFDAQRRMAHRQEILYRVLRAVSEKRDPDAVVQVAAASIANLAGWPSVDVAMLEPESQMWVVQAAEGKLNAGVGMRMPIGRGVIGRAIRTGQTQLVPDVHADPDYIRGHPDERSELAVPLRRGERVLGVLNLADDHPAAFDQDDVRLAELLADAIALAIDNALLYAETRRHASDLDILYIVTRMAGQSLALDQVLNHTLSSVLISFGFDAGAVVLSNHPEGSLQMAAEHGLPSMLVEQLRVSMEGTLCEYVYGKCEPTIIQDMRTPPPDVPVAAAKEMARWGLHSCASVPLLHRDRSLGVLMLFSHHPRALRENERSLLEAIGRQVATAVDNARLFQAMVNERQRLLTLIESSRDGIVFINTEGQIMLINAPAKEMLRLVGSPEEWTSRSVYKLLHTLRRRLPEAARIIRGEIKRIATGDTQPGEGEIAVASRVVHWLNLPVTTDGTTVGRLLVLRDVTEERLLEKMRQDLTHTMVHDLRNPLASVSTALQLLEGQLTDDKASIRLRLIEIARKSLQKMVNLVDSILEVSRLESGRMPLDLQPTSMAELVRQVLQLQMPLAIAKGIRLYSRVGDDLPLVWADPGLIDRTLQNLIGNAIKFTPAGGEVVVAAWHEDTPEPSLSISVTDSGPGIAPELQYRLFQKFVVGEKSKGGSGLGLAFCKLAVKAHGGHIWVESKPGQGATFTFTLPTVGESRR